MGLRVWQQVRQGCDLTARRAALTAAHMAGMQPLHLRGTGRLSMPWSAALRSVMQQGVQASSERRLASCRIPSDSPCPAAPHHATHRKLQAA